MRNIKKIKFVEMNRGDGDSWVSLGGLRFYNKGIIIQSGPLISENLSVADMQNMIARAKSKYHNHYMVHHAVLTTRSQTGNYPNNGYWLAANNEVNAWYEVELKVAQDIDKIEWVQKPDTQYGARGIANPMNIEFYNDSGTLIEKIVTEGNRGANVITQLGIPTKKMKWLIENEDVLKYWTGAGWEPVQDAG